VVKKILIGLLYLFKIFIIRIIHKICDIKSANYLKSGKKSRPDNQIDMSKFSSGEATEKTLYVIDHKGFMSFLCSANEIVSKHKHLRILKPAEQKFLENFLDIVENHYSEHEFGVDFLSHNMAVSQPQLCRKVTAITGRSPVSFIRDLRLKKALSMIKENKEIAMEVGYNNPSCFSRCFQQKFGIKPSSIVI
jgi:AraC-like DNA-binding protein